MTRATQTVGRVSQRDTLDRLQSAITEMDYDDALDLIFGLRTRNGLSVRMHCVVQDLDTGRAYERTVLPGETWEPVLDRPLNAGNWYRSETYLQPPSRAGSVGTPTHLDSASSASASNTLTSGSVSPTANALLIALIFGRSNPARTLSSVTDTFTGTGSWTTNVTPTPAAGASGYANAWIASARLGSSPGSGTVTFTLSANAFYRIMFLAEVAGTDTTTPVGDTDWTAANDDTGSTIATSLTVDADGRSIAGVGDIDMGSDTDITPGTGETEGAEVYLPFGGSQLQAQYQWGTANGASTTPDVTAGVVRDSTTMVAMELLPVAAAADDEEWAGTQALLATPDIAAASIIPITR